MTQRAVADGHNRVPVSIGPAPYCLSCIHMAPGSLAEGSRCAAFPAGIPDEIWDADVDHRLPYPGDHGIVFQGVTPSADESIQFRFDLKRRAMEDDPLAGA